MENGKDTTPAIYVAHPLHAEGKRAIRAQYPRHRIVDRKFGPATKAGLQGDDIIFEENAPSPAPKAAVADAQGTQKCLDDVKTHADIDAIAASEGVSLEGVTKVADKIEAVRDARSATSMGT